MGGVTGAGTVGLNADGNNLSLSYPEGVQRADVSLDNRAFVNVAAGGGGSIAINGPNQRSKYLWYRVSTGTLLEGSNECTELRFRWLRRGTNYVMEKN